MTSWAFLLAAALAMPAAEESGSERAQPPTKPVAAAVRGRVLAADTQRPLRKAAVTMSSEVGPLGPVFTDGDGRFEFTSVPAGRYTITASKSAYVKTMLADPEEANRSLRIDVTDGSAIEALEIQLPKGAAIAGRITDDLGDPAMDVPVTVLKPDPTRQDAYIPVVGTTTDDVGEYRLGGLTAGTFLVGAGRMTDVMARMVSMTKMMEIARTGYSGGIYSLGGTINEKYDVYFPGTADSKDAQPITVVAGEDRTSVDFSVPTIPPPIHEVGGWAFASSGSASVFTDPASGAATIRMTFSGDRKPDDPGSPESPEAPQAAGIIRGRVMRDGGAPLPRAVVTLRSGQRRSILADDDGWYEFAGLPAGQYMIHAARTGYAEADFGQSRSSDPGAPIVLRVGEKREHVDLVLPRRAAIAGQIVDEFGDPVEGATVRAMQVRYVQGGRRLVDVPGAAARRTDDLGRYRVFNLAPGQYIISAVIGHLDLTQPMADLPGYAPTYAPGTWDPAEARRVAVEWSQEIGGIGFPLVPVSTARISGTARSANGDPVTGNLTLFTSRRSSSVLAGMGAKIEPDGSFEFPNVAPGEYVIQIHRDRSPSVEGEFAAQRITVNGTDIADLSLRASPGSTASGRITLEGDGTLARRDVELTTAAADPDMVRMTEHLAVAEIDRDWTFSLGGLAGPRRFRLARAPSGWTLKAVLVNGVDVTDTALSFGRSDQSREDVEIVLTNRITQITGTVRDRYGKAPGRTSVVAFSPDREQWYAASRFLKRSAVRPDGAFAIAGLPPGEYCVAALSSGAASGNDDGSGDEWQDPDVLESLRSEATRVVIDEGQTAALALSAPIR